MLTHTSGMARGQQFPALVWTSDIGPHWCPEPFVTWAGYGQLWLQALKWLAG